MLPPAASTSQATASTWIMALATRSWIRAEARMLARTAATTRSRTSVRRCMPRVLTIWRGPGSWALRLVRACACARHTASVTHATWHQSPALLLMFPRQQVRSWQPARRARRTCPSSQAYLRTSHTTTTCGPRKRCRPGRASGAGAAGTACADDGGGTTRVDYGALG